MAIDARIRSVTEDGADLILELAPRVENPPTGHTTLPGQQRMTIKDFTHKPVAGQVIWGGADTCHIEPSFGVEETRHYKRVGYTTLVEAKPRR